MPIASNYEQIRGFKRFAGETMKDTYPKKILWIALFLFFLFVNFFLMPSPSVGSLETGARIRAYAFQPGTLILLGSCLIGLAGWGRKNLRK